MIINTKKNRNVKMKNENQMQKEIIVGTKESGKETLNKGRSENGLNE